MVVEMSFVEIDFQDLEFYETLGRGSAGSVYRGVWRSKEKIVALKKLNLLEDEAGVLSSLSHRNIIQFFGAVTVAPNFCIVTEYAEMGSLYEYLRQHSIEFKQILQWAKQIALGMNYLHHEAPITVLHRDLKSKNVVIATDLTAKLCDFGSSRFHPHTTNLSLVGTFPWMAPEVIQQMPLTAACDVFSYSVVLWELLTHQVPYRGMEGLQVAWLVVSKEQRLTIPSCCPTVFADLMRRCWCQQPQDRLNFKQILAELENILDDVDVVKEETDLFLHKKEEWKAEIEEQMNELKSMETDLSSRELELSKKEQQLAAREKHLESIVSTSSKHTQRNQDSPEPHDAEQWTEHEVVEWLFTLKGVWSHGVGVADDEHDEVHGAGQLAQYASLFERHHISGRSLFLLTSDDLLHMGILSMGHRKELLGELDILRRNNYRLLHFPPLQLQSTPCTTVVESVTKDLTVIFGCLCREGHTPEAHKCKYLVEFEGAWQGLVQTVQWVFSSSIPPDIVTLSQPPFLAPHWRAGPHTHTLECIITYKDKVQRPHETCHIFKPRVGGDTEELIITLHLHKTAVAKKIVPPSPLLLPTPVGTPTMRPLPPGSPQLSGVWATRANVLRPIFPSDCTSEGVSPGVRSKPGSGTSAVKDSTAVFVFSNSRSSTPCETRSSENSTVRLRNPHQSSNNAHPEHRPIRSMSMVHYASSSSPHHQQNKCTSSERISHTDCSSGDSSRDQSHDSGKDQSWSKVTSKKNRLSGGSLKGTAREVGRASNPNYQRSQSSFTDGQQQSSRGRRGGGRGRGGAKKSYSEPLHKTNNRGHQ